MKLKLLTIAAALCVAVSPANAQNLGRFYLTASAPSASFNCQMASTADEVTICATPQLGWMDIRMARLYRGIKNAVPPQRIQELVKSQNGWLSVRRDCSADVVCIAHAYQLRVNQLYSAIRPVCDGPIMRQPKWCDAGGSSYIGDDEIAALEAGQGE